MSSTRRTSASASQASQSASSLRGGGGWRLRLGCGSGGEEEEVEDACEGGGFGGACLMGAAGAESQEEVGEGMGAAERGAGGRDGKGR